MHQKTKEIQKRYEGFLQTNCLWKDADIYGLQQFKITPKSTKISIEINEKLRLGKYIERLVSFQLSQEKNLTIIAENIQIQQEKITLGELDCILKLQNTYIHLEVIYKFYVYDASVGTTEIAHFIGPNRKDSLVEKLTKLKEKQLPILHSKECKSYLKSIDLQEKNISQQVYFKAQLFIPYSQKIVLSSLNTACIVGFYIHKKELVFFSNCKFYIPQKKDWILTPNKNVNWLNYPDFKEVSKQYLDRNFSPLCWLKNNNGTLEKFFLVWW